MMPDDQVRRALELANRYDAPALRAANQGISVYRQLEPQLRQLRRFTEQVRQAEDYPRWFLVRTFTFARGGWHDAPLLEMPASQFRYVVKDLVDKPDEEVKRELDADIPEYFRHNDHAALWDMVDRWDLFPGWRRQVFEDAFEAHKSGKYTLSVPALAPQIEGMLREATGEYGDGPPLYMWKVNEALDFGKYSRKKPPAAPSVTDLKAAIEELLTLDIHERYERAEQIELQHALFRVNELYNSVDFADLQHADSANRNAILHGVAKDYGELASVKLFCAVQLVHEIVDGYRKTTE